MRRFLPFVLVLAACSKPAETPASTADAKPELPKVSPVQMPKSPAEMAKVMDVGMYPGATAPDDLSTAPQMISATETRYSLVLATNDPVEKVAKWYEKDLGAPSKADANGARSLFGRTKKGNDVRITIEHEAERTLIRLKALVYSK